MDTLMSLPMTASVLTEYGDLEEACRSCGCDGLEVVWGGEELPCTVPQALHVGYHLTFYPDWLDFWRGRPGRTDQRSKGLHRGSGGGRSRLLEDLSSD